MYRKYAKIHAPDKSVFWESFEKRQHENKLYHWQIYQKFTLMFGLSDVTAYLTVFIQHKWFFTLPIKLSSNMNLESQINTFN